MAYICQYGAGPDLGGEEWGFFVGYTIPSIMMALAILIFLAGTPKYKINPPRGSVVATAVKVGLGPCSLCIQYHGPLP